MHQNWETLLVLAVGIALVFIVDAVWFHWLTSKISELPLILSLILSIAIVSVGFLTGSRKGRDLPIFAKARSTAKKQESSQPTFAEDRSVEENANKAAGTLIVYLALAAGFTVGVDHISDTGFNGWKAVAWFAGAFFMCLVPLPLFYCIAWSSPGFNARRELFPTEGASEKKGSAPIVLSDRYYYLVKIDLGLPKHKK